MFRSKTYSCKPLGGDNTDKGLIVKVQPVDMFPQTAYVENVVLPERKD